jgi:hypothetical protein
VRRGGGDPHPTGRLKSDEVPAVLQVGERVLTREEAARYNGAASRQTSAVAVPVPVAVPNVAATTIDVPTPTFGVPKFAAPSVDIPTPTFSGRSIQAPEIDVPVPAWRRPRAPAFPHMRDILRIPDLPRDLDMTPDRLFDIGARGLTSPMSKIMHEIAADDGSSGLRGLGGMGAGRAPNVKVEIINNTGAQIASKTETRTNADGSVLTRLILDTVKDDTARGGMDGVLGGRFGVKPKTGNYS